MANGLLELLMQAREAGRGARADLENSINYYIPPELRGLLGLAAEANPVVSMERAGQDAQRLVQPGLSGWDRMAAAGDMASNMAGVLAPMASRAGVPAANAIEEVLTGLSRTPAAARMMDFGPNEYGGVRLPGGSGMDPATARGQEIMGMLTSGRAGEVTDQMLDLGDPVLNTRLNEYLYSNYDLPMDYGSRMGRAINSGFDVNSEMYRGDAPLLSFQTGAGQREGIGVTGSSRPDVAASYIPARGEGGIYPLMTKGQNDAVISGGGQNWNVIMPNTEVSFQGEADRLSDYIPVDQYFEPYDVMSNTAFFDTNDLARTFQGYGADRVKFQDIVDRGSSAKYYGPESAMPSDVTMVSNPADVRSIFARFDPRLSHLRNLNAALTAGVPLGLLAMQPEQEQY